jgi:hypothetical protein
MRAPRTVSARLLTGAHLRRLKATGVFDADQRRMIGVWRVVKEQTLRNQRGRSIALMCSFVQYKWALHRQSPRHIAVLNAERAVYSLYAQTQLLANPGPDTHKKKQRADFVV